MKRLLLIATILLTAASAHPGAAAPPVTTHRIDGSFPSSYLARAPQAGETLKDSACTARTADPDDSVYLVCDRGRERVVPGNRLYDYLARHPGSYVGHCEETKLASR